MHCDVLLLVVNIEAGQSSSSQSLQSELSRSNVRIKNTFHTSPTGTKRLHQLRGRGGTRRTTTIDTAYFTEISVSFSSFVVQVGRCEGTTRNDAACCAMLGRIFIL